MIFSSVRKFVKKRVLKSFRAEAIVNNLLLYFLCELKKCIAVNSNQVYSAKYHICCSMYMCLRGSFYE